MNGDSRPLKMILVEDSKNDALILEHHLALGGIAAELTRVDSREGLRAALALGGWDLVLADYVLPSFDGLSALEQVRAADPELPCIILSGQVGEEFAVGAMRAGARDFINKNNLSRLISAVNRELRSEEDRRAGRMSRLRLRESEDTFKAITGAAQDGIVMIDPEGAVCFWNPAAERIFGYTAEEALGRGLHALIAPGKDQESFKRMFPEFVRTGEGRAIGSTTLVVARTRDQREIHVELSLSKVHFQNGWHGVAIVRDVTRRIALDAERLRMETLLHQAQKLEAMGRLAAGIAHEINTPIQYLGDNTVFLREACRDMLAYLDSVQAAATAGWSPESLRASLAAGLEALDLAYLRDEIPKAIQQSLDGVARVARFVSAMKDFSHPSMGVKGILDLNRVIESTVLVCRNEWKYMAELDLDLDPELPAISGYADELNQAVLNLVVNAAHAIEAAGLREQGGKGLIRIRTRRAPGHVEIHVSDNGTGIPEAIRERIFDPFFTTKPVGKGTGQGLAIAHDIIVERHRGRIRIDTAPGQGTTFILELPGITKNGKG